MNCKLWGISIIVSNIVNFFFISRLYKVYINIDIEYLDEEEPCDYVERLSIDLLSIMNIQREDLLSKWYVTCLTQ